MAWETSTENTFPWGSVTLLDGELDVRANVNTMLDQRGHGVFVRKRVSPARRCSCWQNNQYDEPRGCSRCDGYGWVYEDYEYKSRRRPAFGTYGFAPKIAAPMGNIIEGDNIFYFKYNNVISEAYRILEVTIDDTGAAEKPYKIERVHDVKVVHAYRDKFGRIEYWAALTRELSVGK